MNLTPDFLRDEILKMAALVETVLNKSAKKDVTLSEIFELENEINKFHSHLDDECFKYIALMKPSAKDLRTAICTMKMCAELERIADQAVKIKRSFRKLSKHYPILDLMIEDVERMVKNSINSFVQGDIKLATDVLQHDQVVNELNKNIIQNSANEIKNNTLDFDEGIHVMHLARNYERIGDLATNIAEDLIFLESGQDVRHQVPKQER